MTARTGGSIIRGAIIGGSILAATVAFGAATAKLFVWPSTSAPRRADAVVVFGARNSERLPGALRLMRAGLAPVLVVMTPPEDRSICAGRPTFEVICKEPQPFSTQGEAREVGILAADRGWDSVLLVTSSYHLTRARLLLERCFGGSVRGITTVPKGGRFKMDKLAHEWVGLVDAETFARGC